MPPNLKHVYYNILWSIRV